MKRITGMLTLSLFLLCGAMLAPLLIGCAATTSSGVIQQQKVAADSLETVGAAIKAVPATMDALFAAGKITTGQYNQVAAIYRQAHSAYLLAVDAMTIYVSSGVQADADRLALQRAALDGIYQQLAVLVAGYQGG